MAAIAVTLVQVRNAPFVPPLDLCYMCQRAFANYITIIRFISLEWQRSFQFGSA
jgi:hypothetical protein